MKWDGGSPEGPWEGPSGGGPPRPLRGLNDVRGLDSIALH